MNRNQSRFVVNHATHRQTFGIQLESLLIATLKHTQFSTIEQQIEPLVVILLWHMNGSLIEQFLCFFQSIEAKFALSTGYKIVSQNNVQVAIIALCQPVVYHLLPIHSSRFKFIVLMQSIQSITIIRINLQQYRLVYVAHQGDALLKGIDRLLVMAHAVIHITHIKVSHRLTILGA